MEVMRAALECAHLGWGESCVIGVAGAGKALMWDVGDGAISRVGLVNPVVR